MHPVNVLLFATLLAAGSSAAVNEGQAITSQQNTNSEYASELFSFYQPSPYTEHSIHSGSFTGQTNCHIHPNCTPVMVCPEEIAIVCRRTHHCPNPWGTPTMRPDLSQYWRTIVDSSGCRVSCLCTEAESEISTPKQRYNGLTHYAKGRSG